MPDPHGTHNKQFGLTPKPKLQPDGSTATDAYPGGGDNRAIEADLDLSEATIPAANVEVTDTDGWFVGDDVEEILDEIATTADALTQTVDATFDSPEGIPGAEVLLTPYSPDYLLGHWNNVIGVDDANDNIGAADTSVGTLGFASRSDGLLAVEARKGVSTDSHAHAGFTDNLANATANAAFSVYYVFDPRSNDEFDVVLWDNGYPNSESLTLEWSSEAGKGGPFPVLCLVHTVAGVKDKLCGWRDSIMPLGYGPYVFGLTADADGWLARLEAEPNGASLTEFFGGGVTGADVLTWTGPGYTMGYGYQDGTDTIGASDADLYGFAFAPQLHSGDQFAAAMLTMWSLVQEHVIPSQSVLFRNTTTNYVSADRNVKNAIETLDDELNTLQGQVTNQGDSANITYDPTGDTFILATDVDGALGELDAAIAGISEDSNVFRGKTGDESVDNGGTGSAYQSDADIVLAVAANEVWAFEGVLFVSSPSATPDFKMAFDFPAAAQCVWAAMDGGGTQQTYDNVGTAPNTATDFISLNAATLTPVFVRGIYQGGANAGNLTLRWAQNTADANAVTVKAKSHMVFRRAYA